jgi:protein arginine kinase
MGLEKNSDRPFHTQLPWSESNNTIWIASELVVRRNIEPFSFPIKMTDNELVEVSSLLEDSLKNQKKSHLEFHKVETISRELKEFLYERFFLTEGYEKNDHGRLLAISEQDNLLALVNFEDHLHLHKFHIGGNVENSRAELYALEKAINKKIRFSFSERFGYLTSDPSISGTGLSARAFLHLPGLIHLCKFQSAIEDLPEEIEIKGLGANDEYLGDLVIIMNKFSLGVTDEVILKSVENFAKKLEGKEREIRSNLGNEDNLKLREIIAKSFGILKNSYTIESSDALAFLSLVSLGIDLNWIEGSKDFAYKDLLFSTRRAHLKEIFRESMKNECLGKIRATHLREKLSKLDEKKLYEDVS